MQDPVNFPILFPSVKADFLTEITGPALKPVPFRSFYSSDKS